MTYKKKRTIIHYLPVYGCIATGIIYAAIGVIALLSFFRVRHGGADESSMLAILNHYTAGKIFIGIILVGTICYIVWRFYETIKDPYEYGNKLKGLAKRTGILLSTIADILIVYAAIRVLFGTTNIREDGQPVEERRIAGDLLEQDYGNWLIICIGVIYMFTSVVQFLYGITRGYRERVDIEHFSSAVRNTTHFFAWVGYLGRGIILGIIGFFFVKAGEAKDAHYVVNTDKAFDFIGDNAGPVCFILTAVATICYGLFMFVQGIAYDTDKD